MLTGPVTILQWSFVRDDQPRAVTVLPDRPGHPRRSDRSGERRASAIIQIDEPAFREGLPLRQADRPGTWTGRSSAFRLASCGVRDATQIHTHMCYSEFNDIIDASPRMDADVITIETVALADGAARCICRLSTIPNDIGPGVYDIHSPRVPTDEEMSALLERA